MEVRPEVPTTPPTDLIGQIIVVEIWPQSATLNGFAAEANELEDSAVRLQQQGDEFDAGRRTLLRSYQSDHDDAMHDRLATIADNYTRAPENAMILARQVCEHAERGRALQRDLNQVVNTQRRFIEHLCEKNQYQLAHPQLYGLARTEAWQKVMSAIGKAQSLRLALASGGWR